MSLTNSMKGKFAVFVFNFHLLPFLWQWLIVALLLVGDTPDHRFARFQASLNRFVAARCEWNVSHTSSASTTDIAAWDFVSQTKHASVCLAWISEKNKK